MRYYELTDTLRRTRPEAQTCTVRLIVSRLQVDELQTVLDRHNGTRIVGSTPLALASLPQRFCVLTRARRISSPRRGLTISR
jgi:hypothetical protein